MVSETMVLGYIGRLVVMNLFTSKGRRKKGDMITTVKFLNENDTFMREKMSKERSMKGHWKKLSKKKATKVVMNYF